MIIKVSVDTPDFDFGHTRQVFHSLSATDLVHTIIPSPELLQIGGGFLSVMHATILEWKQIFLLVMVKCRREWLNAEKNKNYSETTFRELIKSEIFAEDGLCK